MQRVRAVLAGIASLAFVVMPTMALAGSTANGAACKANAECLPGSLCLQNVCAVAPQSDFGIDSTKTGLTGTLGNKSFVTTATQIVNVALSLLGLVAVVIVLIGGFKWMTAGGEEEQVTEGRKWITSGIIGIAIILSAFAITRFVIYNLSQATGSGTVTPQ